MNFRVFLFALMMVGLISKDVAAAWYVVAGRHGLSSCESITRSPIPYYMQRNIQSGPYNDSTCSFPTFYNTVSSGGWGCKNFQNKDQFNAMPKITSAAQYEQSVGSPTSIVSGPYLDSACQYQRQDGFAPFVEAPQEG